MTPESFLKEYLPFAKQTEAKTGIAALAILAQAALESGWGKRAPGFMLFGVKASKDTPINKKQLLTTTEYLSSPNVKFPEVLSIEPQPGGKYRYRVKDWFRKYDNPEECFTDHANFFLKNSRYKEALKVASDPRKFVEEIARAGYATAPDYAKILKSIIDKLEKYV